MNNSAREIYYKERQAKLNFLKDAVELISFDTRIRQLRDPTEILKEAANKIFGIYNFIGISFYLINDEDNSFYQALTIPIKYNKDFEQEYIDLVDSGVFALALNHNEFKFVSSRYEGRFIVLHPIATPIRVHGMFLGIMSDNEYKFPEHAQYLLSLVLFSCANLIDNFKSYNYLQNINKRLEESIFRLESLNKKLEQEISIRKEKEIELKKSEEKYRSIIENIDDAYVEVDLEGKLQFCNMSLSKITGYPIDELIGKHFSELTDTKFRKIILKDIKELFEDKRVGKYRNWKFYTKSGQEIWVESLVSQIRDKDGNVLGFRSILKDVTERVEYERILRESERKYRTIFESTGVPTLIVDSKGTILMANHEVETLFGYTKNEIEGKITLNSFLYNMDWESILGECRLDTDLLQNPHKIKCRGIDKKGDIKELVVAVQHMPDSENCIVSILDLTEQQKLESELRQIRKFEALGTLAGGIAHEFNNILQAIKTHVELIELMDGKSCTNRTYFERIISLLYRAEVVVNRLLTFSRKKEIKMEPVDLNEVIKSAKELLRGGITKRIEIVEKLCHNPVWVRGDLIQLEEVIVNLVNNSVDAIGEKDNGKIEIGVDVVERTNLHDPISVDEEKVAYMWIQDNGCGIEEKDIEKIFTPFYTTKEVGKGTGLGLSIVYGIVNAHNGFIKCESKVGQGTIFKIYLPILSEDLTHKETYVREIITDNKKINAKILVVDDEDMIRDIVKEALEIKGIEVFLAKRGEDAISILKQRGEFDLILMDVDMPGMGGVQCAREVLKIFPGQKIILCSGYGKDTFDGSIEKLEITDFLQKPFTLDKLYTTIAKYLKK